MSVLIYLVPVSLVLLGLAVWAFFWAVKRGQFDDLDTPAIDILAEDAKDPTLRDTAAARAARAAQTQAQHKAQDGDDDRIA
ncbi:cbb3-type cytochrome oxidase assembly protein CcoS [Aquimonas sp.]|jgi:cbb3-type cytochrome oxidase maturation protein|uniref:cbb3-type cytochrome oxidase assembly protein CcoS n=1 Tax=Aquimonas sp. TaxID=1872588 RepID=UPI0037C1B03B